MYVQGIVFYALLVDQNLTVQTTDCIGFICHVGPKYAFGALHCGDVVEHGAVLESKVDLVVGVDHGIRSEAGGDAGAVEKGSGDYGTSV